MSVEAPAYTVDATPAEQPSLAVRLGNTIRNGYEAITGRLDTLKDKATTLAAIGGIAFVGAQAAELVVDSESMAAEGSIPSLTLTTEQQQTCVDTALARPEVYRKPVLYHAGIRLQQVLQVGLLYPALPDYCTPDYFRAAGGVEQTKKGGHWVNTMLNIAYARGNQEGQSTGGTGPSHATPAWVYDECINGSFEKNRLLLHNYVKTGSDGHRKVVAESEHIIPVRVQGNCKAAVRSRQRYAN